MLKLLGCSFILILPQATAANPLAAVMTFESRVVTDEGVTKQTRFQERFIRSENVVWTERIAPATEHHHEHTDEAHEHKHNLNFALAGKWLTLSNDQQVNLKFVRAEDQKIIQPRVTEYGTLGFDGSWELAYYLVDRNALKKMTVVRKQAPSGAIWYQQEDSENFTRILWDERKQIPLSIEAGKRDGSINNKISLAAVAPPKTMPWDNLARYETIDYEDLLD